MHTYDVGNNKWHLHTHTQSPFCARFSGFFSFLAQMKCQFILNCVIDATATFWLFGALEGSLIFALIMICEFKKRKRKASIQIVHKLNILCARSRFRILCCRRNVSEFFFFSWVRNSMGNDCVWIKKRAERRLKTGTVTNNISKRNW